MIARYVKLGTAVAALAAMVVVDVLALPMSAAVAGLLGGLVHRYLLPHETKEPTP